MLNSPLLIKITKLNIENSKLVLGADVEIFPKEENTLPPRIMACFETDGDDRVLPLPANIRGKFLKKGEKQTISYYYEYEIDSLFYNISKVKTLDLSFSASFENNVFENIEIKIFDSGEFYNTEKLFSAKFFNNKIRFVLKKPTKRESFFNVNIKEKKKRIVKFFFVLLFLPFRLLKIKRNRITFLSNRSSKIEDNEKCVYDALKKLEKEHKINLEIKEFCDSNLKIKSIKNIAKFMYLYSTSRVVIVNDYYHFISLTPKKKKVFLLQLWHGGGAFKTVGFSRLGGETKLQQSSTNHRQYDMAIASSKKVVNFYAEGFGISKNKIFLTGIPRSDLFFDKEYQKKFKDEFFLFNSNFIGKKIILFAPTFRGNGKGDCYYPYEEFNLEKILDFAGENSVIITKLHPYLKHRFKVADEYRHRVYNATGKEDINNLLFVSNLLITDYSSVVFEASLLNISTIIYAFDLFDYVSKRDFYVDFFHSLPGKLALNEEELLSALKNQDYEVEKLKQFKTRYMELEDGNSSLRVAKEIISRIK